MCAALENVESIGRKGPAELSCNDRRVNDKRIVRLYFEQIQQVIDHLLHFGFSGIDTPLLGPVRKEHRSKSPRNCPGNCPGKAFGIC
jgi:hypothetical protein